ncbi:hypothetical protein M2459_001352 [Parabacteroides sp. PF5-5]|uniref:hypothetical protein n=1 Tax=unclassified Parabacteroides TaxID=2649774 RepID=UPI0024758C79|nr:MULTISPECIES: hypothetical protein [unclassified Parabacteroides]MDH6304617.1 hypothetical protein [Parabacteroides sp. PH5-39]MDH6315770.1 hypothetical protein [Parabacteroides sp. PF5-13]MDH6319429.1 hypothetical protein [Parabacteroides sp. PH5-13]MDH6323160.1 hypothetical protein [Parabacteroides sp. PH5-8]MDH6326962.1 hypothetical protein [Parabacteroides sp. PH5-41]
MPNFNASNLVMAQALLNQDFQAPELRQAPSPVLTLGQKNSQILIPGHMQLRTREDRPIQAYIIKRNLRTTTGSGRAHDHQGDLGDSLSVDLSWTPFVDKFKFTLKWLDNNMFDANRVLANQFSQAFQNIRNDIEKFLVDYLYAERTQVNIATKNGTWNAANFAFEIASPINGRYWQLAKSMMAQNYYSGLYDVIADPVAYANAEFHAAQGKSNATNFGFQFNGMNIAQSVDLDDANYTNGVSLFLPANTFGVLDWIPKQNRQGEGDYNTYVGGFGSMTDPVSGLVMAVHGYSQRADTSATNGNEQDVVIEFEVSVDISPNLAPLSTANETVVFEVAQA